MASPKLLSSFSIRDLAIKNRVILAPMTRARSGPTRVPNDRMVTYYAARASAGMIITEATVVHPKGHGWVDTPGIYTAEMADAWKKVVDAVHAKDGKICLQLWHLGRAGHSSFLDGDAPVSASAIAIKGDGVHAADGSKQPHEVPRALETDEIPGIVEAYRQGAVFAKDAGFDMIEVHSANGYLLDQFLQTSSNERSDAYGGPVENRFRIVREVLDAVSSVYPSTRVGIRISPNGAFNGMGAPDNRETFTYVAEELEKLNLGYLHVMDGLGFGFHNMCEAMTLADFRKVFTGPLMGNVGYTQETAEEAISRGDTDMISFGRPYLANPDLVERFTNGWPLAEASNPATWYSPVDEGYIDFPTYEESQKEKVEA